MTGPGRQRLGYLMLPLIAALALRLLAVLLLTPPLLLDQLDYHQLAQPIAEGLGYVGELGAPTAYRPVGYPALLGALYALFGAHPLAMKLLQALVGTLSVGAVGLVAGRIGGPATRTRALWIAALYPVDILYTATLYPATLAIGLQWAAILLLWPWLRERGPGEDSDSCWRGFAAGLLLGALGLLKAWGPGVALLLGGLILWLHRGRQGSLRVVAVMALSVSLLLGGWVWRNAAELGTLQLTTNGGANLWVGNHVGASGGYVWPGGTPTLPADEAEASELLRKSALQTIASDPVDAVLRVPRKLGYLLRSDAALLVEMFAFESEGERFDVALGRVPLVARLLVWALHAILFIAGISAWFFGPRGRWRAWSALLGMLHIALAALFFGMPRFHQPLVPLMILGTALLPTRKQEFHLPSLGWQGLYMVVFLFLVAIWLYEAMTLLVA